MIEKATDTLFCFALVLLVQVGFGANTYGQVTQASYQRLSLKVDGDWSRRIESDRVIYDNYNVPNASRAAVVLYAFEKHSDTKTSFEKSWKNIWPDSVAAPRPRRLYTNDGLTIYSNGNLLVNVIGSGYAQLYVFAADDGYQAMLIWHSSQSEFRRRQNEWNMMAQEAIFK